MKKLVFALMLCIASLGYAQVQELSSKYDNIGSFDHGIAIVKTRGKYGAINTEGKEVIKPEWDKLSGFGADGIGYAHKNGLVGLITREGKVIVEPIYERIGGFHYGKAVMVKNKLKGIITLQGKVLVEAQYENIKIEEGGVIRAKKNGQESLLKINE